MPAVSLSGCRFSDLLRWMNHTASGTLKTEFGNLFSKKSLITSWSVIYRHKKTASVGGFVFFWNYFTCRRTECGMMWAMNKELPSTAEFRARLQPLGLSALTELSSRSGVPFHTLLKIKTGITVNPGLETVRKFSPFLADAEKAAA